MSLCLGFALAFSPAPALASDLARRLAQLARGDGSGLRPDESLRRAAEQHGRAILRDRKAAGWAALRASIRAQGLADAQVVPFVAVGRDRAALGKEAERFVADRVAGRGFTQIGVARISDDEGAESALVALFVRRLVELPPLARRLDAPTVLRGLGTHPIHLLEAYTTTPSGDVAKSLVTRAGAKFAVPLAFEDGPGLYRFELLAHTDRGPEVAALWTFAHRVPPGVSSGPGAKSIGTTKAALSEAVARLRASFGRGPLGSDPKLDRAAQAHAEQVCRSLVAAHRTPDGRGPSDRARDAGFEAPVLENIAIAASVSEAHDNLCDSPSHRYNLLDAGAERIGLGLAHRSLRSGPVVCVVELFGVK